MTKFSGEKANDNFEVWLDDFLEATVVGVTQVVLLVSRRSSKGIVATLTEAHRQDQLGHNCSGEYGAHLDPRTAYQCCHKLRYDQFGSSQDLLAAMREYQRMAPQKLTD